MTYILSTVAQKGGVGKSTLARMLAVEAAKDGLEVKIADLDTQQTTCVNWAARRASNKVKPNIRAEAFASADLALKDSSSFDLYIIDGAPHSSSDTLKACRGSDLVVIPSSEGLDDLEPSVILANNLVKQGIAMSKICFALVITSDSDREIASAREYLTSTPYQVLPGEIPFRAAFKTALDRGKSVTEAPFPTLRKRAESLAQKIIDAVPTNSNTEVA